MKIYHTSGEPYGTSGHEYTAAEAAGIVRDFHWAAIDGRTGDVIIGSYRDRASYGTGTPERGHTLAKRLESAGA